MDELTIGFAIGAFIGCVAGIVIYGLLQMAGTDGKTNDESTDYDSL
jgi:type III secretory pathway component EscT